MIFNVKICNKIYRFFASIVDTSNVLALKKITMNIRQQAQILLARRYQRSKHRSRSISSRLAAKIGCTLSTDREKQTELEQII